MRTVPYTSVIKRAAALLNGVEIRNGAVAVNDEVSATLGVFLNRRARQVIELAWWPEWMRVEQRQYRPDHDPAMEYAAEAEVFYPPANKYFQSLQAGNLGHLPATFTGTDYVENSAHWAECRNSYTGRRHASGQSLEIGDLVMNPSDGLVYQCREAHLTTPEFDVTKFGVLTPFRRTIDLRAAGETEIGSVPHDGITDRNPDLHPGQTPRRHAERNGEIILLSDAPVKVWVKFRLPVPAWEGASFHEDTRLAAGEQVLWTDGDYYKALSDTEDGQSPATDPEFFEKVPFPWQFREIVAQGAYADLLGKTEGQNEKFAQALAEFEDLIFRELYKLENQEGQKQPLNILTR